jgi:hypothetical protein
VVTCDRDLTLDNRKKCDATVEPDLATQPGSSITHPPMRLAELFVLHSVTQISPPLIAAAPSTDIPG